MKSNILCIFTKNPEKGKVKTRIGKVKGEEIAMKVYEKLLEHTRTICAALHNSQKIVYFNQKIESEGFWSSEIFDKALQANGNLGIKMNEAFKYIDFNTTRAVLIGSDCGTLQTSHLQEAFDKLDNYDIVLGPATDGGYYLIGMRKYFPFLFVNMPWSKETLLSQTIAKIKANHCTYYTLESLSDVDYWEDWLQLGWRLSD